MRIGRRGKLHSRRSGGNSGGDRDEQPERIDWEHVVKTLTLPPEAGGYGFDLGTVGKMTPYQVMMIAGKKGAKKTLTPMEAREHAAKNSEAQREALEKVARLRKQFTGRDSLD